MSIERSAKVGSIILLFIFLLSSVLSSFFIFKMQNNFTSLDSLTDRLNSVQQARYELATIRSHVNFLMNMKEVNSDNNETMTALVAEAKSLAAKSRATIMDWADVKKMSPEAEKNAQQLTALFYQLLDSIMAPIDTLAYEDVDLSRDFTRLSVLFDEYLAINKAVNNQIAAEQAWMMQPLFTAHLLL